jgi:hypothetical protein
MFYFFYRNFYTLYICNVYKTINWELFIIVQLLIMIGKLFSRNISSTPCVSLKHAPKTCGLILQHVRSLFCKLLTTLHTCFKVFLCCLHNTIIPFTIFSFHPSQLPFGFPTFVVKPRCECFAPFIGVPWLCDTDLLYHPCCNRFIQNKFFYCCSSLVVGIIFIFNYSLELVLKFWFFCVHTPCIS